MNKPVELSLEQQFSLRSFESQVKNMSREQSQAMLMAIYRQMLCQETLYKALLKQEWGIETGPKL